MSSLRLALKQSLAESGTMSTHQPEQESRLKDGRRRKPGRKKREPRLDRIKSNGDRQFKKPKKIRTRLKDNERDVRVHMKRTKHTMSTSLSSSESESSRSSVSDNNSDDDGSSSSDSSNSKSSASNSIDSSNDGSSSDDNSSSDSSSDSSSVENNIAMDGVFDSEVSSENEDDTSSRRKLKKFKKSNRETKIIDQHGKKQKSKSPGALSQRVSKTSGKGSINSERQKSSTSSTSSKGSKKSSWNRQQTATVVPPSHETIVWLRGMSSGKQRRKIAAGMRVKVRFTTKSDNRGKDGKLIHKMKWYGGFVREVGKEGKKIRIKYDDGTSEIANFPDKDIVIDSEGNGSHRVSAHAFIPPPPPPTPPRSSTPIPSFSSKDTKILGFKSVPLHHSNSDSGSISNEFSQNKTKEKCEDDQRLHTPPGIITSEQYISSRQSLSDLKSSTVSESPMSLTHAHGTVSSSTISGCSDSSRSSGSSDHSMSISQPSKETNLSSKSNMSRKRSRSRSSSPTPPNLIPKLSSQIEENDTKSNKEKGTDKYNNRRTSPNPLLTIKLSSLQAKKRLCDSRNFPNSNLSDSSDSGYESPQPRLSRGKTKPFTNLCSPRQRASVSGDESDEYSNNPKHRTSSESTTEEKEWMGDDEGQGLTINKKISRTDIKVSIGSTTSLSNHDSTGSNTMPHHRARSHQGSDLDSDEVYSGSLFQIKPTGTAPTHFQSESTAFSSYVKDRSLEPQSTRGEQVDDSIVDPSGITNINAQTSHSSTRHDSVGDVNPKSNLQSGKKKRNRDMGSRSLSPSSSRKIGRSHSSQEKGTELPFQNVQSKTSISKEFSIISASSTVQNSDSIIMTMQSENGDGNDSNRLPKDSPAATKLEKESDSPTLSTPQTTNSSEEDDEYSLKSKSHLDKSAESNSDNDSRTPTISSRSGRRPVNKSNRRILSRDENSFQVNENSGSKTTKQKGKRKNSRKIRKKGNGDDGGGGNSDEDGNGDNWVKCDRCHKWRLLPSTVNMDTLPDRWYCELNHYDLARSNCEAPEQSIPDVEDVSFPKKSSFSRQNADLLNNSKSKSSQAAHDNFDLDKNSLHSSTSSRPGSIRVDTNALIEGMLTASVESSDEYDSDEESLKNKFVNRRRPGLQDRNSSNDLNENTDGGASDNFSVSKGSSKRNRGRKEVDHDKKSSRGKKKKEKESQEWVQCEKCHKWRKLPLHIEPKDLPDVWYCSMNTWDPRSASCAVAEDDTDGNERNLTIMGCGNGPLSGLNGNGSKLSYRSLIFGSGRRQNRPISERTRAAESLFSSNFLEENNEALNPPTVMYANSSAFLYKGGISSYKMNPETSNESFFDVMSQSGLWDDLYQGARSIQSSSYEKYPIKIVDEVDSGMDEYNYVRCMKAMVYYALGSKVLEGHEVLLEAQCRDWEDHRWSGLRASCTVDIIKKFLDQLVDDGLVEALQQERDNDGNETICYRRAIFDSSNATESTLQEQNSRCMKIAKPWKNT